MHTREPLRIEHDLPLDLLKPDNGASSGQIMDVQRNQDTDNIDHKSRETFNGVSDAMPLVPSSLSLRRELCSWRG